MNVMTNAVWGVVKLGLLAGAIVFAAVGVGQESPAASAAHTRILLSYSNVAPIYASVVVVNPGGVTRDLYAWVVDADEPTGVSAFHLEINFDSEVLAATAMEPVYPLWLGTSGRSPGCAASYEPGRAFIDCTSIGSQPGATGTGILGKLTISPGTVWQIGPLDLTGTRMIDTPPPPDFDMSDIPLILQSTTVVFMHCADFNGDGSVDLFTDILGVIQQFGKVSTDPDWEAIYDINKDDAIDLFSDILGTILQYNLPCNQPA